jgi:stearoyl-CoA desaturase (delta-9 desaturase)
MKKIAFETNGRENPSLQVKNSERVQLIWRNIFLMIYLHLSAVYGAFLLVTGEMMWKTVAWSVLFYNLTAFGITAGAHRYWCHQTFKAKTPLRFLLAFMQTVACQTSIYEWCRDHRLHHKLTETDADPHNARRGFFFAHMGWLMCRKHTEVKEKGRLIDISDLEADTIVKFQKKYYYPLVLTISFAIPTLLPCKIWGETLTTAWFANQLRYVYLLHLAWLVNSAAHLWGPRPYDKRINPAENKAVAFLTYGEGWHNYHHVFPWDYKTSEFGYYHYNFTTAFIDFFAWLGWAYDLKTVSENVVAQRAERTGDGSYWQNTNAPKHQNSIPERGVFVENIAGTDILFSQ